MSSGASQETFQLPSRGVFYKPEECPTGSLTITALTTGNEAILSGASRDGMNNLLNQMIKGCIVDGWKAPLGRMLLSDRIFTLFRIRVLTYGGEYRFPLECPRCGEETEYVIDIDRAMELGTTFAAEELAEPLFTTLPISERRVGWRFLRVDDEAEAQAYAKRNKQTGIASPELIYSYARRILTVDGQEAVPMHQLIQFIKTMHARDRNAWDKEIEAMSFGMADTVVFECRNPKCGKEFKEVLPTSDDFFRPALLGERGVAQVRIGEHVISYDPGANAARHDSGHAGAAPGPVDREPVKEPGEGHEGAGNDEGDTQQGRDPVLTPHFSGSEG